MQTKPATAPNEALSQFVWTLLILGFFGVQAIVWLVAITLTANDNSQAIVAGYDEKALKWDEQRAEQNTSDSLGWGARFRIDDGDEYGHLRRVTVHLTDRQQQSVDGAQVELTIFHCGHSADVQARQLIENEPGIYSANFQMEHAGMWDFALLATRENERFLSRERVEVGAWRIRK